MAFGGTHLNGAPSAPKRALKAGEQVVTFNLLLCDNTGFRGTFRQP